MKYLKLFAAFLVVAGGGAEIAARVSGIIDFPLYIGGPPLGYVPAPNQKGAFLNKNDWAFNERSMGVAQHYSADVHPNILLVGDSIVYGGNPLRQADKLGPTLQRTGCGAVWPAAAGSWAFLNELRWIKQNEDILSTIDSIIFVLNSGDFGEASAWASEWTHPTHYPLWSAMYAFRRYAFSGRLHDNPVYPIIGDNDWKSALSWLLSKYTKPIYVFAYPDQGELASKGLLASRVAQDVDYLRAASKQISVFYVADDVRWNAGNYRDGIHPSAKGNAVFADIIRSATHVCDNR